MVLIHLNVVPSETCLVSNPYIPICTHKHTCILIYNVSFIVMSYSHSGENYWRCYFLYFGNTHLVFILTLFYFSLRSLDMSSNVIQYLPSPAHWKSSNLRELLFSHNQISILDLSEKAYAWSRVEKLHLSHNKLKEVRVIFICLKFLPN